MLRPPPPRRPAGPRRAALVALLAGLLAAPLAPLGAQPPDSAAAAAAAAPAATTPLADASSSREVPRVAIDIFHGVMSPFCPGLLLANCPSPYADSLRKAIVERVERGDTRAQIEAELYATYGEAVRAAPRTTGFGLVAWLAPAAVLLGGGLWLALWLRRASTRRRAVAPAAPAAAADARGSGDGAMTAGDPTRAAELARLDRLVRGEGAR